MEKKEFKKLTLEKAKERQQEIIDDFRTRINEKKSSEMNINEGQFDNEQKSLDATSQDLINKLADELNFVVDEMNFLNKMQVADEVLDRVTLGSVVKTDKRIFFPSVSIEKFYVNGQELFGISDKAPLYQVMKGKTKGESFSYNEDSYKILDVY